ncbi:MAG: hypothetical protein ACREHG_10545, partial [Candidatus Saccharimonadales bacterium]
MEGLARLVTGFEEKPTGPGKETDTAAWQSRADKAAAALYLALEDSQRCHIIGIEDDPIKIWSKLSEVHIQKCPGTIEESANAANLQSSQLPSINTTDWNTDTGASSHMTPHRHWLRNYEKLCVPVWLANGPWQCWIITDFAFKILGAVCDNASNNDT